MREDEALVLRLYDYAESDGIGVFLTRTSGKVRLLVRGLKKLKSPFHGVVSTFHRVAITYRWKGDDRLGTLGIATLTRGVDISTLSLESFYFLSYIYETALQMELDPGSGELLFRLLDASTRTASSGFHEVLLVYFQFWVLKLEGVMPETVACAGCGRALSDTSPPTTFDFGQIHFLCEGCRQQQNKTEETSAMGIFYLFRQFKTLSPEHLISAPLPSLDSRLAACLHRKITEMTGKESKSVRFLLSGQA